MNEVGPLGRIVEGEILTEEEEAYLHRFRRSSEQLDELLREMHERRPSWAVPDEPVADPFDLCEVIEFFAKAGSWLLVVVLIGVAIHAVANA